jgi:predicted DNA-binding protein with PD1-like motif
MQYFKADNQYLVVLAKGENLRGCLEQFARETHVKAAWLQGLGAALELEIGYYDLATKEYSWKRLKGAHEITSLQGNIVQGGDNEPIFHIHGTFSDTECNAYGGHINHLVVGGTCELFLRPLPLELMRQMDPATGLNLLCQLPELKTA